MCSISSIELTSLYGQRQHRALVQADGYELMTTHFPPYLLPLPCPSLLKQKGEKKGRRESRFTMLSSLSNGFRVPASTRSSPTETPNRLRHVHCSSLPHPSLSTLLHKSLLPLVASTAILLCPGPAEAGFMSGITGLESIPGPELPRFDSLTRFNEENQKKYAENDDRFKSSPIIKELLEKSKQNKEKNKKEIQDKYCIRGAEWGVGDCSTAGMTPQEKDDFIAMLKKKADSPN